MRFSAIRICSRRRTLRDALRTFRDRRSCSTRLHVPNEVRPSGGTADIKTALSQRNAKADQVEENLTKTVELEKAERTEQKNMVEHTMKDIIERLSKLKTQAANQDLKRTVKDISGWQPAADIVGGWSPSTKRDVIFANSNVTFGLALMSFRKGCVCLRTLGHATQELLGPSSNAVPGVDRPRPHRRACGIFVRLFCGDCTLQMVLRQADLKRWPLDLHRGRHCGAAHLTHERAVVADASLGQRRHAFFAFRDDSTCYDLEPCPLGEGASALFSVRPRPHRPPATSPVALSPPLGRPSTRLLGVTSAESLRSRASKEFRR